MPAVHDIGGYTVVLNKISHITKVFEAPAKQGAQFNVKLLGDALLRLRFPDHSTAVLERDRLVEAIKHD